MAETPKYKRILLKLSGEGLMGNKDFGIDADTLSKVADDLAELVSKGIEVAVVVGGGNIFRGVSGSAQGMNRVSADYMGMLATMMNGLALQDALEKKNVPARVMSGLAVPTVCEPFMQRKALHHLAKGRVVVFVAGTGCPFFTTDTGSALRAVEIGADAMLKATQVDGVYSADPKKDKNATRYDSLSYQEVISKDLKVMDTAAVALAKENKLPVVVFSLHEDKSLVNVVFGKGKFTEVK